MYNIEQMKRIQAELHTLIDNKAPAKEILKKSQELDNCIIEYYRENM